MTPRALATAEYWSDLIDLSAGISFDRQAHLAERIGGLPWSMDVARGVLTWTSSTGELRAKAMVVGTQSNVSRSWRWADAHAAEELRAIGIERDIFELTNRELACDEETNQHAIGCVATALFDMCGYFCCTHEAGSVLVLVEAPELREGVVDGLLRLTTRFPALMTSGIPISSPMQAFRAYAEVHGFDVREEEPTAEDGEGDDIDTILVVDGPPRRGGYVRARFEDHGTTERFLSIVAHLTPTA